MSLAPTRTCDGCSLCCKVLRIDWLEKPANKRCVHSVPGGCGIHGSHPAGCRDFFCLWIDNAAFGPEWKPDKARFVMTKSPSGRGLLLNVDIDAPDAWKAEPYYSQLKYYAQATQQGNYIVVCVGDRFWAIFPEENLAICELGAGSQISVGYKDSPGGRQPFATVQAGDGSVQSFHGGVYGH